MHIVLLALVFVLSWAAPSVAGCNKADICRMVKKMGHFDILNACPQAGPLLAECKKVSKKPLVNLPEPQFVANDNGTVTDKANHLMWVQKGILVKNSLKTASEFATTFSHEGVIGWRLPTLPELKTLLNHQRETNLSGQKSWVHPVFNDGRGHYYWTTTTCEEISFIEDRYQKKLCQQGDQGAWLVHFNIGAIFWHFVTAKNYFVWPVRDLK